MELAREVYQLTSQFPKSEVFGLVPQMRRCATSIPSNIAEGFGRRYKAEFTRFLDISFGSSAELETQMELSKSLKFVEAPKFAKAEGLLQEVQRMLSKLRTKH